MNIVFIAPPAAGKGTQSKLLSDKYGIVHISTGDLLRSEVASGSELGNHINELLKSGKLVDDEIVFNMLETRLKQKDCDKGYILDGFPRNLEQAKIYDEMAKRLNRPIDYAILLNITREEAMRRITGRVSCPACGAVYNEYSDVFTYSGMCNHCSAKLVKREDDKIETFNQRFDTHLSRTQPIIEHYKMKGILHVVDSGISKENTFAQIESIIGGN